MTVGYTSQRNLRASLPEVSIRICVLSALDDVIAMKKGGYEFEIWENMYILAAN